MPTKKRVLQVIMDDYDFKRFTALQKKLRRKSNSEMLLIMVQDWLDQYEAQNGKLIKSSLNATDDIIHPNITY